MTFAMGSRRWRIFASSHAARITYPGEQAARAQAAARERRAIRFDFIRGCCCTMRRGARGTELQPTSRYRVLSRWYRLTRMLEQAPPAPEVAATRAKRPPSR